MHEVGQILSGIMEIVAYRCQILRLKCTKFDFDWISTPLSLLNYWRWMDMKQFTAAYSTAQVVLDGLKRPTSARKGRGGRRLQEVGREWEGKRKGVEVNGGRRRTPCLPPSPFNRLYPPKSATPPYQCRKMGIIYIHCMYFNARALTSAVTQISNHITTNMFDSTDL